MVSRFPTLLEQGLADLELGLDVGVIGDVAHDGAAMLFERGVDFVSGVEVKSMIKGDTLPSGEVVMDGKQYRVPISKRRPVNIYNKLEKAWKRGGAKGLIDVVESFLKPRKGIPLAPGVVEQQAKDIIKSV